DVEADVAETPRRRRSRAEASSAGSDDAPVPVEAEPDAYAFGGDHHRLHHLRELPLLVSVQRDEDNEDGGRDRDRVEELPRARRLAVEEDVPIRLEQAGQRVEAQDVLN